MPRAKEYLATLLLLTLVSTLCRADEVIIDVIEDVGSSMEETYPAAAGTTSEPMTVDVETSGSRVELRVKADFRELSYSVSRPDNMPAPGDEKLRGFFVVPGTETGIRIGGFAKVDGIFDLRPAGNPDEFVTSSIPTGPRIGGSNNFNIHAKQTRFSLEARRPTDRGELRFYLENDFFGSESGYEYRLTSAYGQLGNYYAGYGLSAFVDADALPNTLDNEGPDGSIFLRTASFRYHWPLRHDSVVSLSAERPVSEISTTPEADAREADTGLQIDAASRVPDFVANLRVKRHWGFVRIGGVVRLLMAEFGSTSDRTWAGGAQISGVVHVFHRDSIQFSLLGGSGVSRYVSDLGGNGLDAVVDEQIDLHRLDSSGGYLAYTRNWNQRWSSNLVLSQVSLERSGFLCPGSSVNSNTLCESPRETRYASVNLLWAPNPSVTAGVEFLYGYIDDQGGRRAETGRIQASVKYRFVQ